MIHWVLMIAGLIFSFVLLVKGADFFVDGCVSVAKLLHVPNLIIGLTIVAMGTSAPEAAVSISGAISNPDNAGITVGNLLGSNLLNILIILGVSSIIVPISVEPSLLKKDFPLLIGSAVIVPVLFWTGHMHGTRFGGFILLAFFLVFMIWTINNATKSRKKALDESSTEESNEKPLSIPKSIIYSVGGLAAVILGGQLAVYCAKDIAHGIGISESLIGLTVVALGTSLPELITSVIAAKKGNGDLALGNVIGSNLFNILLVMGLSMIIAPFSINSANMIDSLCVLAVSILCYIFAATKKKIGRAEGVIFILSYCVYLTYIISRDIL
ncbi:calcium/sodium antiporter [Porcipelethomonas sp.]|uniref:calcium/sodium antiporter n=1 Tax=Porcipelethomonas sp. TaxID=2981675 RepID=UPI003EF5A608